MSKTITTALLLACMLTTVTAPAAHAATRTTTTIPDVVANATFAIVETQGFTPLPANTVFYQDDRINLSLNLRTPHEPVRAQYFIINAKTNKKAKLAIKGRPVLLESMSAGLTVGEVVSQAPGTYYYLIELKVGKKKYKLQTQPFIVKGKTTSSTASALPGAFTITQKPFEFWQSPADREYRVIFEAPAARSASDITGELTVSCSRKVTLYSKEGDVTCDKKKRMVYRSASDLNAHFFVNTEDLEKPITLKATFANKNEKGKTVQRLKQSIILER